MKFVLILIFKLGYSVWYLIRIFFQFIWKFNFNQVDFTAMSPIIEHGESDGYYCKSIIDFWFNRISQSDEVRKKWEANRSEEY